MDDVHRFVGMTAWMHREMNEDVFTFGRVDKQMVESFIER